MLRANNNTGDAISYNTARDFGIGSQVHFDRWYNNATIDQFGIWSGYAMNESEIKALCDNDGVVLPYPFDALVPNTPPTGTVVMNATNHPSNTSSANLTCFNTSQSDADNDELTNAFNWYNDSFKTDIVTDIVHSDNLTAGQNWTLDYILEV